ncbi:MAG: polysaccharide biosynthesis/export family protein [Terracidiphilus sp.]
MSLQQRFNIGRLLLASCILAAGASASFGQYAGPAVTSPAQEASAPSAAMRAPNYEGIEILPGDVISIQTYGVPELTTTEMVASSSIIQGNGPVVPGIKVGANGEIDLPYLGIVKVAGMTPSEAAVYLAKKLKESGILADPQVSVELVDSPTRLISVIGEVVKPAPVPAFGEIRLLDAIAACGGFTPLASHTITVRRADHTITVQLGTDPRQAGRSDIELQPGDTVIVPRVGDVFVVGAVKSQLAIPLAGDYPITVLRAIAMAGGVNYGAALSKARIIRPTADNQHVEIMLDLKKVMYGKQQDVALKSDDVLYIPTNAFKDALSAGAASVAVTALYGIAYTTSVVR